MRGSAQETLTDCLCYSFFFLIKSILQQCQHLILIFSSFLNFFVNAFLASPQVSFQKSIATYERNFLYYNDALFSLMGIIHIEKGVFFVTVFRHFLGTFFLSCYLMLIKKQLIKKTACGKFVNKLQFLCFNLKRIEHFLLFCKDTLIQPCCELGKTHDCP